MLTIDLDDPGPSLTKLLWQPVLPHPRMLDQMIVNRHDLVMILQRHDCPFLCGVARVTRPQLIRVTSGGQTLI
jgi:hypothetical protein